VPEENCRKVSVSGKQKGTFAPVHFSGSDNDAESKLPRVEKLPRAIKGNARSMWHGGDEDASALKQQSQMQHGSDEEDEYEVLDVQWEDSDGDVADTVEVRIDGDMGLQLRWDFSELQQDSDDGDVVDSAELGMDHDMRLQPVCDASEFPGDATSPIWQTATHTLAHVMSLHKDNQWCSERAGELVFGPGASWDAPMSRSEKVRLSLVLAEGELRNLLQERLVEEVADTKSRAACFGCAWDFPMGRGEKIQWLHASVDLILAQACRS
jgi:hypothetical protein